MDCFKCGTKTTVVQTSDLGNRVERRRRCGNADCDYRFVSVEQYLRDNADIKAARSSKITVGELPQIWALIESGEFSQREIGEQFGLSQQQVSKIARNLSWSYLRKNK